jgi:hypothetical protein
MESRFEGLLSAAVAIVFYKGEAVLDLRLKVFETRTYENGRQSYRG